ncbi:MAG: tRNA uridine-5-carboxymethylaminomethyl(34) synthesis GTPase MnmE [Bacteroidales bacterium]|nr:tRNA uridine-5-carboxymethylaminomethyl(34) synthesis GTPase MnmE [Bacteroidales bacterium]
MLNIEDTICAPATVPGTGAIAIIRMSGKDSFRIADKVVSCKGSTISETEGYKLRYGVALEADGTDLDTVLVSVFRSPHSYTGEDSVEISCHSSKYVVERLLQRLVDSGARMAGPGEFTQRAFVNGKMDLAQAEAVADVISSQNAAAHRVAYSQLKGGFSKELKTLRDELLKMTSLLELELDFSEEDVEFASRRELSALLDSALRHIHSLTDSFRYGNALRNGVPVAIVGAVNAGKSTLLNALVGDDRAIVSDIAGTTRDTVEETMTIDGILFRFIDTAGLRTTQDEVEKIGISRSYKKMSEAEIVLALLDVTVPEEENEHSISDIVNNLDVKSQKLIVLLNKVDVLGSNINVSLLNNTVSSPDEKVTKLYISAKTGFGLDTLRTLLSDSQKTATLDSGQTIVTNLRHYQSLMSAAASLEKVRSSLATSQTPDLLSEDLRQALHHLSSILGEVTPDEVLGNIFERFCIGK